MALLPPFLASMSWTAWGLAVLLATLFVIWVFSKFEKPKPMKVPGSVTIITGGSSGIGLSAAKILVKAGGRVALFARKEPQLRAAKAELDALCGDPDRVCTWSVDVADAVACEAAVEEVYSRWKRVDAVINSAGISMPSEFESCSPEQFESVMRVNVLGTRNATAPCVRMMKESGNGGRVVFVSSMAGQCGIFGFTAYSASKFALTGFAQALQMEVKRYGVSVSLMFPPDTDTPLLAEENKSKPPECREISEGYGTMSPEVVASALVSGMIAGDFTIPVGFDGWMVDKLTAGMNPSTLWDAIIQALLMGPVRLVSMYHTYHNYGIVAKHYRAKQQASQRAKSE